MKAKTTLDLADREEGDFVMVSCNFDRDHWLKVPLRIFDGEESPRYYQWGRVREEYWGKPLETGGR